MDENPHLLVTRPVEPHLGRGASNAAIHLGDGNGSPRLPFDLVEEPSWNARSEGEHAATLAWEALRNGQGFVPERHSESL